MTNLEILYRSAFTLKMWFLLTSPTQLSEHWIITIRTFGDCQEIIRIDEKSLDELIDKAADFLKVWGEAFRLNADKE